MIRDVLTGNSLIYGTTQDHSPYIVDDANDPSNGAVRYRGNHLEVYDSMNKRWVMHMGSSVVLTLSPRIESVVIWAEQKMEEEQRERELCEKYPALQIAKNNYETVKALVQNE